MYRNIGHILKKMIKEILDNSAAKHECCSVWIFGSAINNIKPRDIDILYVYIPINQESWIRAIGFRKYMEDQFSKLLNIQPHVILLTESEEAETNFVEDEHCRKIYP